MGIVVVLYIVGIALIMGYLINRYPRERVAIIFLCAIVVLQVSFWSVSTVSFNASSCSDVVALEAFVFSKISESILTLV